MYRKPNMILVMSHYKWADHRSSFFRIESLKITTMSEITVEEPLTSNVRPATDALITIRVIKSFPYRNVKNYIYHDINLKETTPQQLLSKIKEIINTTGAFRPYRNVDYDTLKVYTHAHGTKSMHLVINFEHDDDWVLIGNGLAGSDKTLYELGIDNETELSLFKWDDYAAYKANPEEKW